MSSSLWLQENQEYIEFSDETRSSNMAERYQQLYENEWLDAFTELTVVHGIEEEQAIRMLLDILTVSSTYHIIQFLYTHRVLEL